MNERVKLPGAPDIEVLLRRSARTRRLSLRVSRLDGRVTLSLPVGLQVATAEAFLARKADWVQAHLSRQPRPLVAEIGAMLPVEGALVHVVGAKARRARLGTGEIAVDPRKPAGPQIAGLMKAIARDRLAQSCDRHAKSLGRAYTALVLRDTRSRWGSCSSAGRLMFSWRLAMAPPGVLDYVAAHEVAHLAEMNHSQRFWKVVGRLCADYKAHRAWLRSHGAALHAVRFTSDPR